MNDPLTDRFGTVQVDKGHYLLLSCDRTYSIGHWLDCIQAQMQTSRLALLGHSLRLPSAKVLDTIAADQLRSWARG